MNKWTGTAAAGLLALGMPCTQVWAETADERLDRLEREVRDLRADKAKADQARNDQTSKPSETAPEQRVTLGGYGEINYNNYRSASKQDQIDLRRFVLSFGYRFDDRIKFVSELEFEHGFFEDGEGHGELAMEQAYLQYRFSDAVNLRGGLMLLPVGLLNEYHEPPVFYGVERNEVESRIIPTTWRELGIALQGVVADGFEYNVGLVSSPDSSRHEDASTGFREYRTNASKSPANDFGFYAALNWRGVPGLLLGASVFSGNTAHDGKGSNPSAALEGVNARLTVWDVHAKYTISAFDLRALYASGTLGNTEAINSAAGLAAGSSDAAGKSFYGWYVEGAYHVWREGNHDLAPFVRYERYNTQKEVATGFTTDPKNDEKVVTIGLNYKPHPQVVIKADYQNFKADNTKDRWNLGIGYMF